MSAARNLPHTNMMQYALRPMREQDLAQAAEIERDAFPTQFPPTSFRRELKNHLARYLVAFRTQAPSELVDRHESQSSSASHRFFNRARSIWRGRPSAWKPGEQYIVGFLGTWYMPDDAHIVSVGVRTEYRGCGIGELLLIGAIEQAQQRRMHTLTLEVRKSNYIAQNLYKKYSFETKGVRKGYYSDDREDALIMTASAIHGATYREELRRLIKSHEQRWGITDRIIA